MHTVLRCLPLFECVLTFLLRDLIYPAVSRQSLPGLQACFIHPLCTLPEASQKCAQHALLAALAVGSSGTATAETAAAAAAWQQQRIALMHDKNLMVDIRQALASMARWSLGGGSRPASRVGHSGRPSIRFLAAAGLGAEEFWIPAGRCSHSTLPAEPAAMAGLVTAPAKQHSLPNSMQPQLLSSSSNMAKLILAGEVDLAAALSSVNSSSSNVLVSPPRATPSRTADMGRPREEAGSPLTCTHHMSGYQPGPSLEHLQGGGILWTNPLGVLSDPGTLEAFFGAYSPDISPKNATSSMTEGEECHRASSGSLTAGASRYINSPAVMLESLSHMQRLLANSRSASRAMPAPANIASGDEHADSAQVSSASALSDHSSFRSDGDFALEGYLRLPTLESPSQTNPADGSPGRSFSRPQGTASSRHVGKPQSLSQAHSQQQMSSLQRTNTQPRDATNNAAGKQTTATSFKTSYARSPRIKAARSPQQHHSEPGSPKGNAAMSGKPTTSNKHSTASTHGATNPRTSSYSRPKHECAGMSTGSAVPLPDQQKATMHDKPQSPRHKFQSSTTPVAGSPVAEAMEYERSMLQLCAIGSSHEASMWCGTQSPAPFWPGTIDQCSLTSASDANKCRDVCSSARTGVYQVPIPVAEGTESSTTSNRSSQDSMPSASAVWCPCLQSADDGVGIAVAADNQPTSTLPACTATGQELYVKAILAKHLPEFVSILSQGTDEALSPQTTCCPDEAAAASVPREAEQVHLHQPGHVEAHHCVNSQPVGESREPASMSYSTAANSYMLLADRASPNPDESSVSAAFQSPEPCCSRGSADSGFGPTTPRRSSRGVGHSATFDGVSQLMFNLQALLSPASGKRRSSSQPASPKHSGFGSPTDLLKQHWAAQSQPFCASLSGSRRSTASNDELNLSEFLGCYSPDQGSVSSKQVSRQFSQFNSSLRSVSRRSLEDMATSSSISRQTSMQSVRSSMPNIDGFWAESGVYSNDNSRQPSRHTSRGSLLTSSPRQPSQCSLQAAAWQLQAQQDTPQAPQQTSMAFAARKAVSETGLRSSTSTAVSPATADWHRTSTGAGAVQQTIGTVDAGSRDLTATSSREHQPLRVSVQFSPVKLNLTMSPSPQKAGMLLHGPSRLSCKSLPVTEPTVTPDVVLAAPTQSTCEWNASTASSQAVCDAHAVSGGPFPDPQADTPASTPQDSCMNESSLDAGNGQQPHEVMQTVPSLPGAGASNIRRSETTTQQLKTGTILPMQNSSSQADTDSESTKADTTKQQQVSKRKPGFAKSLLNRLRHRKSDGPRSDKQLVTQSADTQLLIQQFSPLRQAQQQQQQPPGDKARFNQLFVAGMQHGKLRHPGSFSAPVTPSAGSNGTNFAQQTIHKQLALSEADPQQPVRIPSTPSLTTSATAPGAAAVSLPPVLPSPHTQPGMLVGHAAENQSMDLMAHSMQRIAAVLEDYFTWQSPPGSPYSTISCPALGSSEATAAAARLQQCVGVLDNDTQPRAAVDASCEVNDVSAGGNDASIGCHQVHTSHPDVMDMPLHHTEHEHIQRLHGRSDHYQHVAAQQPNSPAAISTDRQGTTRAIHQGQAQDTSDSSPTSYGGNVTSQYREELQFDMDEEEEALLHQQRFGLGDDVIHIQSQHSRHLHQGMSAARCLVAAAEVKMIQPFPAKSRLTTWLHRSCQCECNNTCRCHCCSFPLLL